MHDYKPSFVHDTHMRLYAVFVNCICSASSQPCSCKHFGKLRHMRRQMDACIMAYNQLCILFSLCSWHPTADCMSQTSLHRRTRELSCCVHMHITLLHRKQTVATLDDVYWPPHGPCPGVPSTICTPTLRHTRGNECRPLRPLCTEGTSTGMPCPSMASWSSLMSAYLSLPCSSHMSWTSSSACLPNEP